VKKEVEQMERTIPTKIKISPTVEEIYCRRNRIVEKTLQFYRDSYNFVSVTVGTLSVGRSFNFGR
jgi:hypothetical protein